MPIIRRMVPSVDLELTSEPERSLHQLCLSIAGGTGLNAPSEQPNQ
jgi:hypothetical protein